MVKGNSIFKKNTLSFPSEEVFSGKEGLFAASSTGGDVVK
jgi:hypothetical protein